MNVMWIFVLAIGLVARSSAQAVTAPSTGSGIATISFNAAVLQTAEAKRDMAALQAKYAPRQAHLEALNTEIEGLQKQAANDPTKVSTLNAKEKQLQREGEDFRTESEAASQQAFGVVAEKVYAFLQEYSSQRGYTAVIERGSDQAPVVWYAAANMDITKAVVEGYNARNAADGTATPDAPSIRQGAVPPKPSTVAPKSR
jgi:outer membrane protein